ncbi:hypothetical protein AURDEDRAFT_173526 [Auricularia subglabra TFB-10046 SS5]|nr:hypothetical protein AURDEDRAFT_173526 [Auricularia subglabra TFB-10046 SS5]
MTFRAADGGDWGQKATAFSNAHGFAVVSTIFGIAEAACADLVTRSGGCGQPGGLDPDSMSAAKPM